MPRALPKSDRVYIRRIKMLSLPFQLNTVQQMTEDVALLDSGATENFIDEEVWKKLKIGCFRLNKPLTVHNIDGTENKQGKIEYYCWFKVRHRNKMLQMCFFLTGLGHDRLILGYPFLNAFNLDMDWRAAQLKGGDVFLETMGFEKAQRHVKDCQAAIKKCFGVLHKDEEVWIRKLMMAQQWAHEVRGCQANNEPRILPIEYRRHSIVFDEWVATRFPPEHEEELEIKLLSEVPKEVDCKVYPLSRAEQDMLHQFLTEEEDKGYIYKGSLPYTTPVFLIGKKDSNEKWVVMDYHKLNEWVVHNNGLLPNICTQLEKLTGKQIFLKFNIRWGYKNHRIKEVDQPKAVFKTVFGTYIPQVIYFGLKNAPPFFQRMMAKEFRTLMQKYELYLSNYLDDWIIATPGGEDGLALHRQITHDFLDMLEHRSYFLKIGKCEFEQSCIEFLGWLITPEGVTVDPSKAAGLSQWPQTLKNIKELRRTLGVLGYQRPFIRGYAQIAKPLTDLMKKGIPFCWEEQHTEALNKLIQMVTTTPVLGCSDPE
jgi:hypothetical protein